MLVFNLIKALSKNVSSKQKAIAKNSMADWVTSLALVIFMHVITIAIINFNDLLIEMIEKVFTTGSDISSVMLVIVDNCFSWNFVLSWACVIVYGIMVVQTFRFLLIYIKRFLVVEFLVIISPFIPVTYSYDKMKGGTGRALNAWLSEMIYNVFVQLVHAVIYTVIVGGAMEVLKDATSIGGLKDLASAVMVIASMFFVKPAEKMIKTIFGFDKAQSITNSVFENSINGVRNFVGNVARTTSNVSASLGAGGAGALGGAGNFGQNLDAVNGTIKNNSAQARNNGLPTRNDAIDAQYEPVEDGTNSRRNRNNQDGEQAALPARGETTRENNSGSSGAGGSVAGAGFLGGLMTGGQGPLGEKLSDTNRKLEEAVKETQNNGKEVKEQTHTHEKEEKEITVEKEKDSPAETDPQVLAEFRNKLNEINGQIVQLRKQQAEEYSKNMEEYRKLVRKKWATTFSRSYC